MMQVIENEHIHLGMKIKATLAMWISHEGCVFVSGLARRAHWSLRSCVAVCEGKALSVSCLPHQIRVTLVTGWNLFYSERQQRTVIRRKTGLKKKTIGQWHWGSQGTPFHLRFSNCRLCQWVSHNQQQNTK